MLTKTLSLLAILLVVAIPANAQTTLGLTSPMDYQVFQRHSAQAGKVVVSGKIASGPLPENAVAEGRFTGKSLAGELPGKWQALTMDNSARTFHIEMQVPAGGWYQFEVRLMSKDEQLAALKVERVGVGDVYVVAGQSNSSNHGQTKQNPQSGLVSGFDGKHWQAANDPQPGASGGQGSFMPPFGDAMVDKFKVPAGIVACGIGATSVREWLPKGTKFPNPPTLEGHVRKLPDGEWESKGDIYEMFTARMKQMGPNGFRAVLWHQGESDADQPDPKRTLIGKPYRQFLEQLIKDSRREIGWDAPWVVALVSSHGGEGVPALRDAQKSLWDDGIAVEGPDSDALRGDLRDGVHFSGKGLQKHGQAWAEKVSAWMVKTGIR